MPLTDTAIKALKPETKPRKYADGGGLYLLVQPTGAKWWRLDYRFKGKRKTLSMGTYPPVSLKMARARRDEAREMLAQDIDPGAVRKAAEAERVADVENAFEEIARQWFCGQQKVLAESTADRLLTRLEKDVFPVIGPRRIDALAAPDVLQIIKRVEARGAYDTARRIRNDVGRIFRYAVAHGLCTRDPSRDIELRDVLHAAPPVRHHPGLTTPQEVGALLRAIEGYTGTHLAHRALMLTPLVFLWPGELRQAEWSEIDLDRAEWRIPAAKMKMRDPHTVPLARQAVAILRELRPLTGDGRYVFPSIRTRSRPMSENTVNAALRRLGYTSDQQTAHGFRTTASTLLHELGFPHAVIERQLAHTERNKVAAAYNHAEHLPERRQMMQAWADYLDRLKAGAEVISLHSSTG